MKLNVNVGDKVVCDSRFKDRRIGTVVNITEKRKDIVVDYGNYKETYDPEGYSKGGDIWYSSHIELLTPEIEEEMRRSKLISECCKAFDSKCKQLTADQAEKILSILNEREITK